jgi:threonine/homoserine/homoserine lactone efflux protein
MDLLWQGIKIGLILCFMIGPVFFALLQTAVEEGFRAAAMVGAGIWTSDLAYILLVYFGLTFVKQYTESGQIEVAIGVVGTLLFIIFGLVALLTPPKNLLLPDDQLYQRSSSYFSLYLKGFLLNVFNPFTIFLWIGIMSTILIDQELSSGKAVTFFTGIIATVIITDLLKIVLSKRIRNIIQPKHLIWIRKGTGIALLSFGIFLAIRTMTIM